MAKTPDQIRRETTPHKYYALTLGLLGLVVGVVVWLGGWVLLNQKQARLYPRYCLLAIQTEMSKASFGRPPIHKFPGKPETQYNLMRFGNPGHEYDLDILRNRLYPAHVKPFVWVRNNAQIQPIYSAPASLVLAWPCGLLSLTVLGFVVWGAVLDARYQRSLICGVHLDGTVLATVDEYNKEVKGDGMRYAVKEWTDR